MFFQVCLFVWTIFQAPLPHFLLWDHPVATLHRKVFSSLRVRYLLVFEFFILPCCKIKEEKICNSDNQTFWSNNLIHCQQRMFRWSSRLSYSLLVEWLGFESVFWRLFLFHACAVEQQGMGTSIQWRQYSRISPTCDAIPKIITWGSVFRFANAQRTALTPPLVGPSLGRLEPHGSRGFLSKGEAACTLRGNWWMSSRKNGKRTAGTPDGTCGQPGRGDYSLDPWWFSSTPSWGGRFSSGTHSARRASGPQDGKLFRRGEY